MRIIAGSLGGRIFDSPRGHRTHPMSDKIRGGLFNALGDITGLSVLDAFAGSGALGFEALSRGAKTVTAIDNDKSAQATIAGNAKALGLTKSYKLITASANGWLQTSPAAKTYDLVFCDPPYDDVQLPLITRLTVKVAPHGVLVLSWPGGLEAPVLSGFTVLRQKSYGDAQLIFYSRSAD